MRKLLLASLAALGMWGMPVDSAHAQAFPKAASPTPGNLVVRLDGRLRFYAAGIFDNNLDAGTGAKSSQYGFFSYVRLYPGFDGITANGLKYGASVEIRQDSHGWGGAGASGLTPTNGELYFRREWGYVGTDTLGTIRVGSTDGPISLFSTGTFENFNSGGWNGDEPGFFNAPMGYWYPFGYSGNLYTTEKIVYLSPSIYGFDFGLSYEPNSTSVTGDANQSCAATAGSLCSNLASSSAAAGYSRRRNTWNPALRYRGAFGGVGVALEADYLGSSKVAKTSPTGTNYMGLSVFDFGATVSFGGLEVGGHYTTGQMNGSFQLEPNGGTAAQAWIIGASYTMGPAIVGVQYLDYQSTGNAALIHVSQSRQKGVAIGGTYNVAPGFALFASGLWGQFRQNGYDWVAGTPGPAHNTVHGSQVTLGTVFSW